MKTAHLTSVHQRYDTRIFLKQCRSLANHDYDVSLVVADGKGDEQIDGVKIYDVGAPKGRINRMLFSARRVFRKAKEVDADIYHLHDPELIPAGLRLKRRGRIVIFDAHEDVPLQLKSKPYLGRFTRWMLSKLFSLFERFTCSKFDAIVAATPMIREKYQHINNNVVDINNFPLLSEFDFQTNTSHKKKNQVCYIGGYTAIRGLKELVTAMPFVKNGTRLVMGGFFSELEFEREVKTLQGWSLIEDAGYLDRTAIIKLLSESIAGLVTLHPTSAYLNSLPVKMFEYMAAGLPVIASDFPLWRRIVEENNCGLCVDPHDPEVIAAAIDHLVSHPSEACEMGNNGRKAVETQFNWEIEEKKLIALYQMLLKQN